MLAPVAAALALGVALLARPGLSEANATQGLDAPRSELVEMTITDVVAIEDSHAVMLKSNEGTVLPVFVDPDGAVAIAFKLAHQPPPHAFASDLAGDLIGEMGGKVSEVRIGDIRSHMNTSRIMIRQGKKTVTVDARASDSLVLALASDAKIYATPELVEAAGITREEIDALREAMPQAPEPGVGGSGTPQELGGPSPDTPPIPQSRGGNEIRL